MVRARAFNHAGPGQEPIYALASFASQMAAGLAAGERPVRIVTGSADTRRDYTDVRDVVRAYRLLAEHGEPGLFNICSGVSRSARELVAGLAAVAGVEVVHEVDPARVRANEVPDVRGSAERLHAATGWQPQIPFEQTLRDTLAWWRSRLQTQTLAAARTKGTALSEAVERRAELLGENAGAVDLAGGEGLRADAVDLEHGAVAAAVDDRDDQDRGHAELGELGELGRVAGLVAGDDLARDAVLDHVAGRRVVVERPA